MRHSFAACLAGVLIYQATLLGTASAQSTAQSPAAGDGFDPRNFTGIWMTRHEETGGYRSLTVEQDVPPRTPWGEARFRTTVTGRTTLPLGPGVPPVIGNDPIMRCNPEGYPRVLFFQRPLEIFHVGDRILMLFQWQRALREVWLDGRALPENPLPTWYGHSVGHWEGDTLVINSVGFDDRAWLDIFGNVFSDEMRLQERWRRVGPDALEVVIRLEDPKTYTREWVTKPKLFQRETSFNLDEEICAPMDEILFNQTIRDPAGAGADAGGRVDDEMLERFAHALADIESLRARFGAEMQQATSREAAYEIEQTGKTAMMEAVRATGLSLEDYQDTAELVNADRDVRDVVMQRVTELCCAP